MQQAALDTGTVGAQTAMQRDPRRNSRIAATPGVSTGAVVTRER
jgi:hypothetical protein